MQTLNWERPRTKHPMCCTVECEVTKTMPRGKLLQHSEKGTHQEVRVVEVEELVHEVEDAQP